MRAVICHSTEERVMLFAETQKNVSSRSLKHGRKKKFLSLILQVWQVPPRRQKTLTALWLLGEKTTKDHTVAKGHRYRSKKDWGVGYRSKEALTKTVLQHWKGPRKTALRHQKQGQNKMALQPKKWPKKTSLEYKSLTEFDYTWLCSVLLYCASLQHRATWHSDLSSLPHDTVISTACHMTQWFNSLPHDTVT